MATVSIARCTTYEQKQVEEAVYTCLDNIPEIKSKISKGAKVLVKANLLMKHDPTDAVTTHPAVVKAIVRYLQAIGCRVIIGDSPGGPFNIGRLTGIYKATGMTRIAEETGCDLNYDIATVTVMLEQAKKINNIQIIKIAQDVDFVVSAAKLKTHGMMVYTGAVKNLFGVIPGLIKAEYHFKMHDPSDFAHHLVDLCKYINPVFSVIDAIEGMEGDGPSAGQKKHAGLIMASESPYVLDKAALQIIGINPWAVPTVKAAVERGLCSEDQTDFEVKGLQLAEIQIPPFKPPETLNKHLISGLVPEFMENFFVKSLRAKPVFNYAVCNSCGDCARGCPAGIIDMGRGRPIVDLAKCINCFCCHELCPKQAIIIKKHWLHRLLFR